MNDDPLDLTGAVKVCTVGKGKVITFDLVVALMNEFSRNGMKEVPPDRAEHLVDEFQPIMLDEVMGD